MNVLLRKCENKTHYNLEINRRNGKPFRKLRGFLCFILLKALLKKKNHLLSLLLLLVTSVFMFTSCIWHTFEKLIGF